MLGVAAIGWLFLVLLATAYAGAVFVVINASTHTREAFFYFVNSSNSSKFHHETCATAHACTCAYTTEFMQ